MPENYTDILTDEELLEFAENLVYPENDLFSTLYPDEKTPNLKAKWYSMMDNYNVPLMAEVYAFDTETKLRPRMPLREVSIEKLFIKDKISESEKFQLLLDSGVTDANAQLDFITDDIRALGVGIIARMNVMKADLTTTGMITLHENNTNTVIDYGVPATNKVTFDWTDPDHDILTDILNMIEVSESQGKTINKAITTPEIKSLLMRNNVINKMIYGAANSGAYVTENQLNGLLTEMFGGLTLEINKDQYKWQAADGTLPMKRYVPSNKFVLAATQPDGSIGAGLWGVTPEELDARTFDQADPYNNFVYITRWREKDPATRYIKASAVGVAALWDPESLNIADITIPAARIAGFSMPAPVGGTVDSGTDTGEPLDVLAVKSAAGSASGETEITVDGNSGALLYKIADRPTAVTFGQSVKAGSTFKVLNGESPYVLEDMTENNGKQIYVVEVDSNNTAVAAGQTVIVVKE